MGGEGKSGWTGNQGGGSLVQIRTSPKGLQHSLNASSVLFRVTVRHSICKISLTLAYHRTIIGCYVCR